MTLSCLLTGVVGGGFTMILLLMYFSMQARRRQSAATDTPQRLECEVCGVRMESWDTAKQHAVGSHNAITDETWPDIIQGVE